jgi:sugar-specific transcriptional regulator TrmB
MIVNYGKVKMAFDRGVIDRLKAKTIDDIDIDQYDNEIMNDAFLHGLTYSTIQECITSIENKFNIRLSNENTLQNS